MFGNNNIRCVRVGKGGGGEAPGVYFSKGGYISATRAIEINRDTIEFSREKKTGFVFTKLSQK